MATDDSLLRMRPKSTILDEIGRARKALPESEDSAQPEQPPSDRLIPLPLPGSAYDAAHARPDNNPVPMLRFVYGDTIRGFPYANLDSIDLVPADKPGAGPTIVMRFNGIAAREARIAGRHLLLLFDLLSDYRIGWVRELPKGRDFKDEKATVITGITIGILKELSD